jgi:hypothetical protein
VAFSPGGRRLGSGSGDDTVRLWDVDSGREMYTLIGHTEGVWSVAFSPNGRLLASGAEDNAVRLWNVDGGREVHTLTGHTDRVRGVAFSPDGRLLASGSWDNTMRLWDVDSGREVHALTGHTNWVSGVAYSPDGRLLASCSSDRTVQLWDVSALDVGPKPVKPRPAAIPTDLHAPLRTHLRTWPLAHVAAPDLAPDRPAAWLRGAAAAGWPLPLALAHDLGLLLTHPAGELTIAKPDHLPYDEDTAVYLAFLQRIATHPLVRELPTWQPPLSDAVLAVVLARLVEGLELPDVYRPPTGSAGAIFGHALAAEIKSADLTRLWRETPPGARPHWDDLLSPDPGAH